MATENLHYYMAVRRTRQSRVLSHVALEVCATGYLGFVNSLIFIQFGKGVTGDLDTKDSWVCMWEHAKIWTKVCLTCVPKGSAGIALKLVPHSNRFI